MSLSPFAVFRGTSRFLIPLCDRTLRLSITSRPLLSMNPKPEAVNPTTSSLLKPMTRRKLLLTSTMVPSSISETTMRVGLR